MKNHLTINKIFAGKDIRTVWDKEKEEYYFSVVDVVEALTDSPNARKYWSVLKLRLKEEGSQLTTMCSQLKLQSQDGKCYFQDVLDTEGIFRLIQSIPSPKAEPLKLWLAKLGRERINETFDPSIAVDRAVEIYRRKGYEDNWIEKRLKGILSRKKLTDIWQEGGIEEEIEYAMLTNEIYETWSGMSAKEYKIYKNIRKESLRDNMSDVEVALTDLGELATKELAKEYKPYGLEANKRIAKEGGNVAKETRIVLEEKLGKSIVSKNNSLNYQYDKKLSDNK